MLDEQEANELWADSSPQQTVVNTWATVDMLNVVADQLDAMADLEAEIATASADATADSADARVPALIFIAVLVGCLTLAIQPGAITRTRFEASSDASFSSTSFPATATTGVNHD